MLSVVLNRISRKIHSLVSNCEKEKAPKDSKETQGAGTKHRESKSSTKVDVKDSNGKINHPTVIEYFKPGIGFGGSCFPKDVEAIRTHGNNLQLPMRILNSVLDVNAEQIEFTLNLLTKKIPNIS